jgi:hypothetical protein
MGFHEGCEKGVQVWGNEKIGAIDENASRRLWGSAYIRTCIV